jgi:hypothetical protein
VRRAARRRSRAPPLTIHTLRQLVQRGVAHERPTRVTRGSARSLKIPSVSLSDSSAARWACAPSTMRRNLIISKVRPARPTRGCRKNTGPGESSSIARATSAPNGARATRPRVEPITSTPRLMTREERPRPGRLTPSTVTPRRRRGGRGLDHSAGEESSAPRRHVQAARRSGTGVPQPVLPSRYSPLLSSRGGSEAGASTKTYASSGPCREPLRNGSALQTPRLRHKPPTSRHFGKFELLFSGKLAPRGSAQGLAGDKSL